MGELWLYRWASNHPFHRRLCPYLASRVMDSDLKLSERVGKELRFLRVECSIHSMALAAETSRLLQAFESSPIGVIPLKGASLAKRLYDGLDVRPFGDVDLFVEPGMIGDACSLVEGLGYKYIGSNPSHYHREYFLESKTGRTKFHLELHERLMGNAIWGDHWAFGLMGSRGLSEEMWRRSSIEDGHRMLAITDELVFLTLHLSKHIVMGRHVRAGGSSLSAMALDIHLFIERWGIRIDWSNLMRTARGFKLTRPLALGFYFTDLWFGGLPDVPKEQFRKDFESLPPSIHAWAFESKRSSECSDSLKPREYSHLKMLRDSMIMSNNFLDMFAVVPGFFSEVVRRRLCAWLMFCMA
ncbi:nucleotidyltransferase domain-containing protein [Pseudohalioglobus lutimaris]|nr:nucleotidyltransferase family protein [Pseudohalioglobus lutimaris]